MEAKDKAYVINTKDITPGVAPLHYESNSWCPIINEDIEVYITEIRPGGRADKDNHTESDHVFYYLSGFGYNICDGERFDVGPGDFLFVPRHVDHEMYVIGQETLRMVAILAPTRDMKKKTLTYSHKK